MANTVLRQVIVKLSQVCNINCTYCYVYNMGDDSWSKRTRYIQRQTIDVLTRRIAEHCDKYNLATFHVELHGGEPLMAGKELVRYLLSEVSSLETSTEFSFSIQTNGLLLDSEWVCLLQEFNVNIGVSIDGPPELADRNRIDKQGRGTTQKLLGVIREIQTQVPSFKPGVLCVLSPESNVPKLIDWFYQNGFHSFDFLLPSGNYVTPPYGVTDTTLFADILIDGFRHWLSYGEKAPQIRIFETIIESYLGRAIVLDSQGGDLRQLCVIESDGSIAVNDVARMCGGAMSEDKINIFESPLDVHGEIYDLDELQVLSDKCRACRFVRTCGGGYLPHRYDGRSFCNPTIYCSTQYQLNLEIENFMKSNLPSMFEVS